ncbi:hypothetical protein [Paenibacillus mendelii]|uniref:Lipoprotein n=1 Tax=Paenibacillus mendelii TaxID=206163 RepID=A0ABV6J351_9BACL|nr:hypothetical protein [Paenibacillus mendelii]MCQ6559416.1 hypothetical protein [Paenibacillus mendelii]
MLLRWRVGILLLLLAAAAVVGFILYQDITSNDDIDSSPTVVAAIEKQRGPGHVSYMIHEHAVPDGQVAFFIRNMPSDGIHIGAEYIKKTPNGWKWGYGGEFGRSNYELGLTDTEARREMFEPMYFSSTEGTEFDSPFPMVFGIVIHPDIRRMTAKDYLTGLEKQAELIEVERNFKLFYVFLDRNQGTKFDITGYTADGSVLHKETIQDEADQQSHR